MSTPEAAGVHTVLARLRARGIRVRVDGTDLRLDAPSDTLDAELVELVRGHKAAIIETFASNATAPGTDGWTAGQVPRAGPRSTYPLSPAQRRLFFLQLLDPDSTAYHIVDVFRIEGELDPVRVEGALRAVMDRHATFRTGFEMVDGEPVQRVHDSVSFQLEICHQPDFDPERLGDFVRPHDMAQPPLLRARLVEVSDELRFLLLDIHHLVYDGGSRDTFAADFVAAYQGKSLPPATIGYHDYAVWLRSTMNGPRMMRAAAHWEAEFGTEPPRLELSPARPRPDRWDFAGDRLRFGLGDELASNVRAFCRDRDVTLFVVLLAAYNVLLHRFSGQQEFVVGFPVDTRAEHGLADAVGMFVNTVAIRSCPAVERTFESYLDEVRDKVAAGLDGSQYPFDALVERISRTRDLNRNPLFDTFFSLDRALDTGASRWADLGWREQGFDPGNALFDLTLNAVESRSGIDLELEYATALLDRETVQNMAEHLTAIVRTVVADPAVRIGEVDSSPPAELERLDRLAHQGGRTQRGGTLTELVAGAPDATAIVGPQETLDYAGLERRTGALASRLRSEHGIGRGDVVALFGEWTTELVIAVLAVLRTGAAFLPLAVDDVPHRLASQLRTAGASMLLARPERARQAPDAVPVLVLDGTAFSGNSHHTEDSSRPDDPAYVMFTSGSTGEPKGVVISHRAIANRMRTLVERYDVGPADAFLLNAPASFDISVGELFVPLAAGGRVVLLEPGSHRDPVAMRDAISAHSATLAHFVPSMLTQFLRACDGAVPPTLRTVFVGGETLSRATARQFFETFGAGVSLVNQYGPTEAAIDVIDHQVRSDESVIPIGRPYPNVSAHVHNPFGIPVPVGSPGELCVGGEQLAEGYAGRPDLTAERFVERRHGDERLYRTGDLVRWTADGELEFLGRIDRQVKIRGRRIEPDEVAAVLRDHPDVADVLVRAWPESGEATMLVAYVLPTAEREVACLVASLAEQAGRCLPPYLRPGWYVPITVVPRTSSGKVNWSALPAADQSDTAEPGEPIAAPITETERALADIWAAVLRVENVGRDFDFFDQGGHSLLAVELIFRVRDRFAVEIALVDFFERPVLAELAERIDRARRVLP